MNEVSLDELSAGRLAELLRTTFQVLVEPGLVVRLELTAMTTPRVRDPEHPTAASPPVECFALLFDGPADRPLTQRTYRFAHDRLGHFDLFIVPVGAERNARQYEAVFNRRLAPAVSAE